MTPWKTDFMKDSSIIERTVSSNKGGVQHRERLLGRACVARALLGPTSRASRRAFLGRYGSQDDRPRRALLRRDDARREARIATKGRALTRRSETFEQMLLLARRQRGVALMGVCNVPRRIRSATGGSISRSKRRARAVGHARPRGGGPRGYRRRVDPSRSTAGQRRGSQLRPDPRRRPLCRQERLTCRSTR